MIKVLLFAQLQEQAQTNQLEIHETSLTVQQLRETLRSKYNLPIKDHVFIAVNEEYAPNDFIIRDGDTVAIIPPVSGG
ncbi:molybdopterin converting factor subunit 1 [Bacillus sp. FJAT-47783]|uniref:molybdopterin converting factor subunit 1 n=1 Tax=Bacillus sp. FJAT-47783 TaxID=2922712 RepID=UPI001FAB6E37|nr:molybdopterin converting factor subunit 1 [Bacillus sp. FJAT-47783]